MYIIGSRCGGYNFWAILNNEKIWLGEREKSDFDVILEKGEKIIDGAEIHKGEIGFFRGHKCPYYKNKLYVPDSKEYLCEATERRLFKLRMLRFCCLSNNKKISFINMEGIEIYSSIFKVRLLPCRNI